jgi:hypothetical protein
MTTPATRPGPTGRAARPSLGDQLDRLDGILNGLADALNQSVTAAVTAAVGNAVREAATRELAARSGPQAAMITDSGLAVAGRPRRLFRARVRAVVGRMFASAGRTTGRFFRRLGAPLVALARRTAQAPGRFAASALAGVVAGALAGLSGPLIGAVLGGLAAFAAALSAKSGG